MAGERTDAAALTADEVRRIQRRSVWVLSAGQVLGGLAFGATLSLGAVLAAQLSGDDAFSGLAAAAVTLGTAVSGSSSAASWTPRAAEDCRTARLAGSGTRGQPCRRPPAFPAR